MQLTDFDRAVCLLGPNREADRVRDLMARRGVPLAIWPNGPRADRPPPASWQGNAYQYAHFTAIRDVVSLARDDALRSLLIVEDDLELTPDFDSVVGDAEIPADWALLYYGANHSFHPTDEAGRNVLRLHGSFCTHCVGIRAACFEPILALPEVGPIDCAIGFHLHPILPAYALWPNVAVQRPGPSLLTGAHADYSACFRRKGTNWPRVSDPGRGERPR